MDGEVVHALLGLLDQGVAEQLPGQVLGDAVDLLQRLVDRHGTDRHWRVADDPFAGFVDVLAGGQVHHRVRAPADAPGQLGHFFFDRRTQRRIADIAVDLHQEVAADDHRLQLGVVDVRRDDGTAPGYFVANEFGGYFLRNRGTEALPGMLLGEQASRARFLQLHIFADGDELHLGRDDALTRVVHLADVLAWLGAARIAHVGETHLGEFGIREAQLTELRGEAVEQLGVAAVIDPCRAHVSQAFTHIDGHARIGVGAGGVVHQHRCVDLATEICGCHIETDLAHRHADVRARTLHIDFLRARERLDRPLVDLGRFTQVLLFCTHQAGSSKVVGANLKNTADEGHRGAPGLAPRELSERLASTSCSLRRP